MKSFLKWTALTSVAAVSAAVAYTWVSAARARLSRGLERAERIADDTRQALAKTQDALGETERAVHDVRGAIG